MKPWYQIKNVAEGHAELWIYEQIGEDWWTGEGVTAKRFAKDLAALDVATIDMHINSPGGVVWDGQAIYNAVVNHPATVTTYIDGLAASIASVIALAGDKVVMAANALFMIHNPYGGVVGTSADMRQMADVLDKVRDTIAGVYDKHSTLTPEEITEAMDAETWYSASEAAEAGFVDEVAGEIKLAACFDLSRFKHAPAVPQAAVTETAESQDAEPEDAAGAVADSSEEGGAPTQIVSRNRIFRKEQQ